MGAGNDAREMAQCVRSIVAQCENLSSNPRIHIKVGIVAHVCNPAFLQEMGNGDRRISKNRKACELGM